MAKMNHSHTTGEKQNMSEIFQIGFNSTALNKTDDGYSDTDYWDHGHLKQKYV
jgi:hypothetical protein